MDIKLGLIGGGYWGKNLIREFNNTKSLHTICDINKEDVDGRQRRFLRYQFLNFLHSYVYVG